MKYEGEVKKTPVALMNFQSYFLQLVRNHKRKEKKSSKEIIIKKGTMCNGHESIPINPDRPGLPEEWTLPLEYSFPRMV